MTRAVVGVERRAADLAREIGHASTADQQRVTVDAEVRMRGVLRVAVSMQWLRPGTHDASPLLQEERSCAASAGRSYLPFGLRGSDSRQSMWAGTM